MSEPAMLADHLDQHTETILAHWKATVDRVGNVPEASRLPRAEFLDHIPALLERLAERLRGRPADATVEGQLHGQHRWRQGYDIAEVVAEFGHLRTALIRSTSSFARDHGWDLGRFETSLAAINDVLDEATAESVRQFQGDSARETKQALSEVKSRQRAIEEAWVTARLERSKLRTILRSLPAAVWVADPDGSIIGTNDLAERMQGFVTSPEAPRPNVFDLGPGYRLLRPDGTPCAEADLPIVRALQGQTVGPEEFVWVLAGEPRTVSVNAAPLSDAVDQVLGAVAVVTDLTPRKRLEAELAASEGRFRVMAERSPVLIWQTDADGRCLYVNQTWCEFRGLPAEHHLGQRWDDGVHPEDRDRASTEFRQALAERTPLERSYRMLRHDGEYRWVSDRSTPLLDGGGEFCGFLGSCLDITPRIDLEAVLQRQRATAEESSRHKTRLVSALSHDVRTPLNAVVLAAQLLEVHLEGGAADPEVEECLRTIRHSVRNVLDLLNDLLDLSKIDAGVTPPEVSRFTLDEVFAECLASIEPQARVKGLEVRTSPGKLAGASLETDRSKLKQLLSNLLSNALRYTEKGEVCLFASRGGGRIRVGVRDTGMGIDPADQARIFDEFAVLEHPQRKAGEGTGLGLAICRRLAALLGGEIELESTPGEGSTFSLVLPDSVLTLTAPPVVPGRAPGGGYIGAGAVLIAEDHADSRQTLARVLRRMGLRVLEADNGRDAVELALAEPDLKAVLMDVNMPGMNGVDATIALRADGRLKDVPIFALTGDVTADNHHRIAEAGVTGFLEKPVTWDALRDALDSVGDRVAG